MMSKRDARVRNALSLVLLVVASTALAQQAPPPPKAGAPLKPPKALPPGKAVGCQAGGACGALTPAAVQAVIGKIAESVKRAEEDVKQNGAAGAYADAARYNLNHLKAARASMATLQTWLKQNGLDSPCVTNTSAAYNVHGYTAEAVVALLHARHWCAVSIAYHGPKNVDGQASYALTSQAIDLAQDLGAKAGRCYVAAYVK